LDVGLFFSHRKRMDDQRFDNRLYRLFHLGDGECLALTRDGKIALDDYMTGYNIEYGNSTW